MRTVFVLNTPQKYSNFIIKFSVLELIKTSSKSGKCFISEENHHRYKFEYLKSINNNK